MHVWHIRVIVSDESEFESFDGIDRDSAFREVVEDVNLVAVRVDDGIIE